MRRRITNEGFLRFISALCCVTLVVRPSFAIADLYTTTPYYIDYIDFLVLLLLGIVFWLFLLRLFKVRRHIIEARIQNTERLGVMGFFDAFIYNFGLYKKSKHLSFWIPYFLLIVVGIMFLVDLILLQAVQSGVFFEEFAGLTTLRLVFNALLVSAGLVAIVSAPLVARPYNAPPTNPN